METPNIQLFVPFFRVEESLEEIRVCLEKGWTGLGFKTVEFENAWKDYTKLPYAHFLSSATAGLHLAVELLKESEKWSDGDEIITTPLTFVSTNHAILYSNLRPIFADVDDTLCLNPESILTHLSPRTRAVMFVGIGGNTGRLQDVVSLCRQRGLKLILDASHMAGTRWINGEHIGKEADVAVFSFQAVKNLPTADSGMICFQNEKMDATVRKWSWLGINKDTYSRTQSQGTYKWYYDVEKVGYKEHGNSIMAAMGLVSLRYLEQDNAYRRQVSDWYDLHLASADDIKRVPMNPDCIASRHLYQILVENRDEVILALNQAGIFPGVHYRDNTVYKMYSYAFSTCPNSMNASQQLISLPLHLRLTYDQVQYVSETLKSIPNNLHNPM